MSWYLDVLKKYATFSGRARRKEYWMFMLFNVIIYVVLGILMQVADAFLYVYLAYALATLLPSLAVLVRRLHDTGRSGWWIFISLVPFIGGIWLLVLTIQEGQATDNAYGPNPKAVTA